MTMSAKLAATVLALALVPSAFAAGAAHADASKSTWKNATAKASHKIAVEVGLVPDSSSPVKCTRTLLLRQDKRVVLTQRPKKTAVEMDERLIQGDLPIIRYRRHRRALIEQAGTALGR